MRRELIYIEGILANVMNAEINDEPAEIAPEYFQNEDVSKIVQYFTPLLEEAGLLRRVKGQPDFADLNCFRMTLKGHCFFDLCRIYDETKTKGNSLETLLARIAVTGFH